MKVLLTLYGDETTWETEPEDIARAMAAWQAFDDAAREAGVLIACDGLTLGQKKIAALRTYGCSLFGIHHGLAGSA